MPNGLPQYDESTQTVRFVFLVEGKPTTGWVTFDCLKFKFACSDPKTTGPSCYLANKKAIDDIARRKFKEGKTTHVASSDCLWNL